MGDAKFIGCLNLSHSLHSRGNCQWGVANAVANLLLQHIIVGHYGIRDLLAKRAGLSSVFAVLAVSAGALHAYQVEVPHYQFSALTKY